MKPLSRSSASTRCWKNAFPIPAKTTPRRKAERAWRNPAAAVTERVRPIRHFWARPTTTKQSQWLGMSVWRSARVNVEKSATESLTMRRRLYPRAGGRE